MTPKENINIDYHPFPPHSSLEESKEENFKQNNSSNNNTKELDPISIIFKLIRTYPGRSAYIFTIFCAFILTIFPWFKIDNDIYFYYSLIEKNIFSSIYLISLLVLITIRLIIWFKNEIYISFKNFLDYLETILTGAILMYILTINYLGEVRFGLIISNYACIGITIYLTYLKLHKKNT